MFSGSIPALVTPFREDSSIDWLALENLVEWHVNAGSTALVINGTTGESATLSEDEKLSILERVIGQVAGRLPIIAGTGSPSTAATIYQSQQAMKLGASACLIITPYYNRPNQEGLYQHYITIAEQLAGPIIVYNVPKRTGCDLLPQTMARFAAVENIIGLKDATGDIERLKAQQALTPQRFILLSGDDLSAVDFMLAGGHGVVSVVANLAPITMSKLCQAACYKELELAMALNKQLNDLCLGLQAETNPITVKWLLSAMGKIKGVLRLPLTPLSQPYHSLLSPWITKINAMEKQNANQITASKENTYV
jgi:4-hydroxy-tetrahydrodipicolinate synthase